MTETKKSLGGAGTPSTKLPTIQDKAEMDMIIDRLIGLQVNLTTAALSIKSRVSALNGTLPESPYLAIPTTNLDDLPVVDRIFRHIADIEHITSAIFEIDQHFSIIVRKPC